jgi:glucose-1-phosphate cytidylyltransferase
MTIKAIILCGGQGTRIRDVAENIPKPMIPIGDRPILWHIMRTYAHYGVKDFVLCLGYRGWSIKEFFLNFSAFVSDVSLDLSRPQDIRFDNYEFPERDWKIVFAETGLATQTGGRIWQVRKYLDPDDIFCVTYGDGVADIDIKELIAFHRRHGKIATVTGVRPPGRFGVMMARAQAGEATLVTEFVEKPQTGEGLINGGYFVFDHRLWEYMNDAPDLIFEREPLRDLASAGQLALFQHRGFWQPMDTYREWKLLNDLWDKGEAPWKR